MFPPNRRHRHLRIGRALTTSRAPTSIRIKSVPIDEVRRTLTRCLEQLDAFGFDHAAAHLDMALHQLDRDLKPTDSSLFARRGQRQSHL